MSQDDPFFPADKGVTLPTDSGLGKHLARLLKGGGGHPTAGVQHRLFDPKQRRTRNRGRAPLREDMCIGRAEGEAVHGLPWQKLGIAAVADLDVLEHLAHEAFAVLVMQIDPRLPVHALHFSDKIAAHGKTACDSEQFMWVDGTSAPQRPARLR